MSPLLIIIIAAICCLMMTVMFIGGIILLIINAKQTDGVSHARESWIGGTDKYSSD